jgi:hypothetical protein
MIWLLIAPAVAGIVLSLVVTERFKIPSQN